MTYTYMQLLEMAKDGDLLRYGGTDGIEAGGVLSNGC